MSSPDRVAGNGKGWGQLRPEGEWWPREEGEPRPSFHGGRRHPGPPRPWTIETRWKKGAWGGETDWKVSCRLRTKTARDQALRFLRHRDRGLPIAYRAGWDEAAARRVAARIRGSE